MSNPAVITAEIHRLPRDCSRATHEAHRPGAELTTPFGPGERKATSVGGLLTEDEVEAAGAAIRDFRPTLGTEGEAIARKSAAFLGVRHSPFGNSGSSASLIAISARTMHKLPAHLPLRPPSPRAWQLEPPMRQPQPGIA